MTEPRQDATAINRDLAIRESDRSWHDAVDRLKYATDYAQAGLKGLFLANGAAIVSLLTFLGNAKDSSVNPIGIWWAFAWFSVGLAGILLAYILGYVAHASYMQAALNYSRQADSAAHQTVRAPDDQSHGIHGSLAENAGIGLAVGSLVAFVVGAFVALEAIV